jgi:Protein of unknown function (DUF3277)
MGIKHWSPDQVDVIFGGVPVSGFSEDAIIKLTEANDRFSLTAGVLGDLTRSKDPAVHGVLTVSLMLSSRSNDVLSAMHQADILAPGGAGVVPCAVNDRNGTGLFVAPESWIIRFPDWELAKKVGKVDWSIQVVNYKLFIGGT